MTCIAPGCRRKRVAAAHPFCGVHARGTAAQKGGWLSAHQRRAQMALDANPVYHRLWMGAAPPTDRVMAQLDAIVLCAAEYQPVMAYQGAIIRCPLADAEPTPNDLAMATAAAKQAGTIWKRGGKILITCAQGRNRSGLVTGLLLLGETRKPAPEVIAMIRRARRNALTNRHFVTVLEGVSRLDAAARRR